MGNGIVSKCCIKSDIADDSTSALFIGGYIGEELETRTGFVAIKMVDEGGSDDMSLSSENFIVMLPNCREIERIHFDEKKLISVGTDTDGKPYVAIVDFNDGTSEPAIIRLTLDTIIDKVNKVIPYHTDRTSYVLIGERHFDNGAHTSLVGMIDTELVSSKSIVTTDKDTGEALLITLCDIATDGTDIFVCGVSHPTESVKPLGILAKFDNDLSLLSNIIVDSPTIASSIIKVMVVGEKDLSMLIEVRRDDGEVGVICRRADLALNGFIDDGRIVNATTQQGELEQDSQSEESVDESGGQPEADPEPDSQSDGDCIPDDSI